MELSQIRRANLLVLLEQYGADREFADRARIAPGFLSQLKMGGDAGGRNIGEKLARRLEAELNLESGWLDQPQHLGSISKEVERTIAWIRDGTKKPRNMAEAGEWLFTDIKHHRREVPVSSWKRLNAWSAEDSEFPFALRQETAEWIPLPPKKPFNPALFALPIEADSMFNPSNPKMSFPEGCYIYVDPGQTDAVNGQLVLARLKDAEVAVFKQLKIEDGGRYLKALNPDFSYMFPDFRIIGRVIGKYDYQEF